jgi:Uma2 family endonuclease
MSQARRRATYDDLLKVPDWKVAEIIDGELIVSPRPATPHAYVSSIVGVDVGGRFHGPPGDPDRPGGWWLLDEPELHLGEDVLVPDLAGWRRARLPVLPAAAFLTEVPDWVCEVISPSTATIDRARKMRIYAREGVGHLWLIDPAPRTLEVYRLENGRWIVAANHGGDDVIRAEPFAAVGLALERWWLPAPAAASDRA